MPSQAQHSIKRLLEGRRFGGNFRTIFLEVLLMSDCDSCATPGGAGPFSEGRELVEFVNAAHGGAIRNQPIPNGGGLRTNCRGCGKEFILETKKKKYFVKIFASFRTMDGCKRYSRMIEDALKKGVHTPKLL